LWPLILVSSTDSPKRRSHTLRPSADHGVYRRAIGRTTTVATPGPQERTVPDVPAPSFSGVMQPAAPAMLDADGARQHWAMPRAGSAFVNEMAILQQLRSGQGPALWRLAITAHQGVSLFTDRMRSLSVRYASTLTDGRQKSRSGFCSWSFRHRRPR